MSDQLSNDERVRLEALTLAVQYTTRREIYDGNSVIGGTVRVAKQYERYLRSGS